MARLKRSNRRASASPTSTERRRSGRPANRLPARDMGVALGASRMFAVTGKPHGPFAVAALLDEVKRRLVSRGGRPADPSPTVRRLVPLKKQVWRDLQTRAEQLSGLGKPISPGQLAAILLEKSVETMSVVEEEEAREEPRLPFDRTIVESNRGR